MAILTFNFDSDIVTDLIIVMMREKDESSANIIDEKMSNRGQQHQTGLSSQNMPKPWNSRSALCS